MDKSKLIGQSKTFDEKITNINSQFFSALDDFKKYYVYFNKNPEVNEFQNFYENSKGQLQTISKNLFVVTNAVDSSIEKLDNKMSSISVQLEDEKKLNKEMMDILTNLQNTQNGSEILIDDSKTKYNEQYYKNIQIIVGIFIVSGLLASLFKKK
jgi:hypothetical protein